MSSVLLVMMSYFTNYKSGAAAIAGALTALSGFFGFIPGIVAFALVGLCVAIAHLFQDIADHGLNVNEAKQDLSAVNERLQQLENAINGQTPPPASPVAAEPRSTIPFSAGAALLFLFVVSGGCIAQDRPPVLTSMQLSPDTRSWFRNPDGSCVQCSIGMAGVHANDLNAASLLWDTSYGAAVRGGSWPSRVEQYCDQRGIKAWSVTGKTVEETMPWMVWAAKTGRFAAIGAGASHFQTLYGYEPNSDRPWMVCNNNSPTRIDRYTDREFRQLHAASGPWVVILEKPSSDPPSFVKWWK